MKTEVIRADNEGLAEAFQAWLHRQTGARLIVIEGLPGAGKSTLLERCAPHIRTLELDTLLCREEATTDMPWSDQILSAGAAHRIEELLRADPPALIEGPVAWPVVKAACALPCQALRRVYLKRLTVSGGAEDWLEGRMISWSVQDANGEYWASIHRYHAGRPWEAADLIAERVDRPITPADLVDQFSRGSQ